MNNKKFVSFGLFLVFVAVVLAFVFSSISVEAVQPFGSNITEISNQTLSTQPAGSAAAIAGNVTEVNLDGFTTTQSWQGYYGNVTGTLVLADGGNHQLYNWSDASPKGEVYASTNDSLIWTNIQCFNYTATGTYADDSANRGGTSQYGMNLTQLESSYNIPYDAADSINNTFNLNGTGNHANFYTNNLQFGDGTCHSTRLYTDTGTSQAGKFEEVLLYDPNTRSVVFTTILNQDILGFDGRSHDFEMIVPEDGHKADTATTTYYFYVELQ